MMPVPNPSQASDDDDTNTRGEPIAIVGIGCRFPGDVATPEAYWRLLLDGVDAITEVPPDRWNGKAHYDPEPGVRGKTCQRWGGFVADIDRFDPQAFGISPREAACIDPQHRLLLETAWEAIDDAGLSQAELAGSRTAVFVGLSGIDYAILQTGRTDLHDIDVYTNIGSSLSIAANRVSYTFDLRGPSVSVDTACSSSLVALHLACESLRRGDCAAALAGGVNVLLTPDGYVGFSRMSMLSPDGRCHAFDASANGFVRSEGAGMLFLRPLSLAVAHRDRIYAVIRATAVNQDGRTAGITVPSQSAQEALVREACRRGGVDPAEIGYMEAHGTGTLVGDPIELRALGAVLGEGRDPDRPCWVGSSKTNIGHLEAASGMAGVIKTALMLQRRQIPRNLHFRTPNPEIDFSRLKLRVPQQTESWPTGFERAIAGVNSFGFGGTNAHVLLAEPPRAASRIDGRFAEPERELGIPLSARSLEALQATARSWSDWLSSSKEQASLIDIAYTAGLRRTHHDWRAMVVARTPDEVKQQLKHLAEGSVPGVLPSRRVEEGLDKRIVFVCAGQGPQWWGMGRELLRSEPIFRGVMEQCDAILRTYGGWSLLEELARSEADSRMHDTAIAQPALFAVQIALAALWKAWGIEPAAVTGHSVGEVAAAYLADVFSLEDALKVIFERGRCMDLAPAGGRMLAAGVGPDEARELAKPYDGRVGIAAVNSPCSVTLSGDAPLLEEIAADLTARKIFCRLLKVDYAFHSSHMDSIEEDLTASLRFIDPRTARLPFVSTVTGERADGLELGPVYWWRNVRQPVLFAKAIERLLSDGYDAFVELGPHPVLLTSLEECARAADRTIIAVASLRRQLGERREMLKSLGRLYVHGAAVRWNRVNGNDGELLRLPNYPWQRERCWRESSASEAMRLADPGHPLLGRRLPAAQTIWQRRLVLREVRCLPDHRVQGSAILPATAYLEAALSAQRELFGPGHHVIENIRFDRPAVLSDERDALLQTSWNGALRRLEVSSRSADADHDWTRHASMRLRTQAVERVPSGEPLTELLRRCPAEHGRDEVYAAFRRSGLEFGLHFQGVERLYVGVHEAVAEVRLPEAVRAELSDFHWHPAALDACFHAVGGVDPNFFSVRHDLLLPVEIDEVRCYGRPEGVMWSHARRLEQGERSLTADVLIMTGDGRCVMEIRRLVCQKIAGGQPRESVESLLYAMKWTYAGEAVAGMGLPASAAEVAERAGLEIARLREHVPCLRERYEALDKRLRPICAGYVDAALRELGWRPAAEERFAAAELSNRLGIPRSFDRFLNRALEMLVEDGVLERDGDEYCYRRPSSCPDLESAWRQIWRENSLFYAELTLLGRCGRALSKMLSGAESPQRVIFPEDRWETAEQLYHDSSSVWYYNRAAQRALSAWVGLRPRGSALRILEVGAGTGGLTGHLLPVLPAERTEYVFSDVSNQFLHRAGQKFADYPFLKFHRLDLEQDPLEQGLSSGRFDAIVASQVLHATSDVRATLQRLRTLLAPGGMLLFSEIVRPSIWIELVFGLMDGWWRFHDVAIRRDSPLLPVDAWLRQLREVGFAEPKEIAGADDRLGNAVFLAGAPPIARTTSDDRSTTIPPRRRLVFADRQGVAEELLHRWTSDGDDVWLVTPGEAYRRISPRRFTVRPTERDDFTKLVAKLSAADGPPCEEVLHFWNLDAPGGASLSTGEIERWQGPGLLSVLNVVQTFLATHGGAAMPRLRLVTRGTQTISADDRPTDIAAAPVLGLARVIGNEAPQFRCQAIDLDPRSRISDAVDALWRELAQDSDEEEIVLRDGGRWVSRYERCGEPRKDVSAWPNSADRPRYRLETAEQGTVEGLRFREAARPALGSGEVEIEVFAAGLNFSDVLKSLGLYPGLPAGPAPFGAECSGRITAVGSGAGPWRIGDEVIAVAPFSFASHVVARSELVIRKPRGMTFEEAATLPIAFLTASYALETMGRLSRGERVLIHAATGGVGLAALQIARNIGAEAYATAGSREKRDLLRFLGVGRVMDSRKLEFADEILAATQGEGVDVVLNSLPGEAISLGLSVLRDYGRFLEIGKRDIYADAPVGLKPFRKNVSFHAIDLDRLLRDRPQTVGELFRRLEREFAAGRLTPLPFRVFPAAQIVDAFRYMQQGRHIGKVVASMFDPPRTVVAGEDRRCRFGSDRSYLITGGLSGFGLACARWMAERGAGELVLMGRRGVASSEARAALDELTSRGANISVAVGDVSKSADVERVFAEIDRNGLPLAGIIHGAMVLEDSLLTNLDAEMASRVLAPKVSGAWNLHRASEGRPLDFFVMFSSLSSVIGHAGQANYAAANTFLDQLAHHRRAQGLPATTINWGYLGDVGILARNERIAERLEGQGVRPIPIGEALEALEVVLSRRPTQIGVMRMDWSRWRQTAVGRVSPRFAGLCTAAEPTSAATDGESGSIRQQILDAPENQRVEVLTRFLRDKLARVLGAAAGQIDASHSLLSLGIDSLMAVDLRNWIERELQFTVPVVELMGSAGLAALAEVLLRQLTVGPAAETASDQVPVAAVKVSDREALPAAESVERLNDADVDRLLAELLPKGDASPR